MHAYLNNLTQTVICHLKTTTIIKQGADRPFALPFYDHVRVWAFYVSKGYILHRKIRRTL